MYLPGKYNVVADALSRAPHAHLPDSASSPTLAPSKFKFSDIEPVLASTAVPPANPPSEDKTQAARHSHRIAGQHNAGTCSPAAPALAAPATVPLNPPMEDEIRQAQWDDSLYGPLMEALERKEKLLPNRRIQVSQLYLDDSGLLCYKSKHKSKTLKASRKLVVIPEALESRILPLFHESKEAAHCGKQKAVHLAQQRFFFPHLIDKVMKHVQPCKQCPYYNGSTNEPAPALK